MRVSKAKVMMCWDLNAAMVKQQWGLVSSVHTSEENGNTALNPLKAEETDRDIIPYFAFLKSCD